MKLPPTVTIAREKITHYLLVPQTRGDKSVFLNRGGFTSQNPDDLIAELLDLAGRGEAVGERKQIWTLFRGTRRN